MLPVSGFLYVYLPLGTEVIVHCVVALLKHPMSTVELVDKWGLVDTKKVHICVFHISFCVFVYLCMCICLNVH